MGKDSILLSGLPRLHLSYISNQEYNLTTMVQYLTFLAKVYAALFKLWAVCQSCISGKKQKLITVYLALARVRHLKVSVFSCCSFWLVIIECTESLVLSSPTGQESEWPDRSRPCSTLRCPMRITSEKEEVIPKRANWSRWSRFPFMKPWPSPSTKASRKRWALFSASPGSTATCHRNTRSPPTCNITVPNHREIQVIAYIFIYSNQNGH